MISPGGRMYAFYITSGGRSIRSAPILSVCTTQTRDLSDTTPTVTPPDLTGMGIVCDPFLPAITISVPCSSASEKSPQNNRYPPCKRNPFQTAKAKPQSAAWLFSPGIDSASGKHIFSVQKNTTTGEAGGCHLTGIALCSSRTRRTCKYDVTCVKTLSTGYSDLHSLSDHCRFLLLTSYTFWYNFIVIHPYDAESLLRAVEQLADPSIIEAGISCLPP